MATLATTGEPLVDLSHEIGGREVGPHLGVVGDEAGFLVLAFGPVPEGHYAARVEPCPGCPVDAPCGIGEELDPDVVADYGFDVGHQGIALTGGGHQPDAECLH